MGNTIPDGDRLADKSEKFVEDVVQALDRPETRADRRERYRLTLTDLTVLDGYYETEIESLTEQRQMLVDRARFLGQARDNADKMLDDETQIKPSDVELKALAEHYKKEAENAQTIAREFSANAGLYRDMLDGDK